MIHTESFTTKSVVSKPSSQLFTANQIRETTISRVEKTFCPITKNLSEVLGFRTFSSSCPFSLLETSLRRWLCKHFERGSEFCSQVYFLKLAFWDGRKLKFTISCLKRARKWFFSGAGKQEHAISSQGRSKAVVYYCNSFPENDNLLPSFGYKKMSTIFNEHALITFPWNYVQEDKQRILFSNALQVSRNAIMDIWGYGRLYPTAFF